MLLSHHPLHQKEHIITLDVCTFRISLCARCSGILSGLILSYALLTFLFPSKAIDNAMSKGLAILFIFIFLVNWSIPYFSEKTITRHSRFCSGILCGAALSLAAVTETTILQVAVSIGVFYILAVKTYIMIKHYWRK